MTLADILRVAYTEMRPHALREGVSVAAALAGIEAGRADALPKARAKVAAALAECEARGVEIPSLRKAAALIDTKIGPRRTDRPRRKKWKRVPAHPPAALEAKGQARDLRDLREALTSLVEALTSLVEALEGDVPEGVLDAYDAACDALGLDPVVLGTWIEQATDLRDLEEEATG